MKTIQLESLSINGEDLFVFNNQVGSVEALFGADTDTAAQARAEYVYSAYGEVMMKSGDLAEKNNITYSTRYKEANTGLVSYTYRHYSPRLKKWLSKDPIAEQGGLNLYQMVGNMPISSWDMLGHAYQACHIYIFVGHSGAIYDPNNPEYPILNMNSTVPSAVNDAIGEAISNKALNPDNIAFGVVSCFSTQSNVLLNNGGFGFIDISDTTPNINNAMDPQNPNAPTRGQFNIHLRQSYEKAKERRKTMCLDKTACCPDVTIEIKWIGGNYGENDLVYKTYLYFTPKIDTEKCIR